MSEALHICTPLSTLAREAPERPAVIAPSGSLTYGRLEELSNRCAAGFAALEVTRGTHVALMVRPGLEFAVLAFALIKVGAVLVLVDPGMGWRYLGECLSEARPEAFVGSPRAQLARLVLGWARASARRKVTVGRPRWGGVDYRRLLEGGPEFQASPTDPNQTAAIVFTSGSTGVPKGVVYTHRMFSALVELMRAQFRIQAGEVDLATFPLFALFDPALGMTTVFPEMDFTRPGRVNPATLLETVRRHRVTHMFGSPALLDRVGRYGEQRGIRLDSVRRVLSAGAPVPDPVLERFGALLPEGAEIHTPYGATEALPVCSITARERLQERAPERGVCVGRPLAGVRLEVIRITDDAVAEWSDDLPVGDGEVGELVVWGDNVSPAYYRRQGANRLAKIRTPQGEVRHRTGDLGWRDERGRIWFCGRKAHRVQSGQGTLFTVPCENVFNQHGAVYRSALVGVGEAPRQKPVLCVELEDRRNWRGSATLRDEILALGRAHEITRPVQTLLFHRAFPVDVRHNSKIFREELARWAAGRLA